MSEDVSNTKTRRNKRKSYHSKLMMKLTSKYDGKINVFFHSSKLLNSYKDWHLDDSEIKKTSRK